ncbi:hypothetical protein PMIN04_001652 [Paraphaeosphaeria minitans]|uniref:Uncharacterized protein n=1 Tax=Paraphaeosphaeria minitans TaxID=565426 RepID=A0A9P6G9A0_9PLEO|nr:hypothetical protein PMIN01_11148 [Paraphaeosphaeria minitans]
MRSKNSTRGQGLSGGSRVAAAGSAGIWRSGESANGCGEMFDALASTTAVGSDELAQQPHKGAAIGEVDASAEHFQRALSIER